MQALFVDTGAFVSRYLARDQHHARSQAAWAKLKDQPLELNTSNFVLDETFTLLARRAGYAFAAERARAVLASPGLRILRPDADDELSALRWFEKFADHQVSYTDCISFTLMARYRIDTAFAFDRDFSDAGYRLWTGTASKCQN